MSFCGTHRANRNAGFLALALHTIVMYDPLMRVEDARFEMREGKRRQRRPQPEIRKVQLEIFPFEKKIVDDFESLGKTLRYFFTSYRQEVTKSLPKPEAWSFVTETAGLEYCDYEFYRFWYGLITTVGEAEFEKELTCVEYIGKGIPLDDYEPTIKFLSRINSRALAEHNYNRGGCF
jgi:hypothetical protein